jgi:RNase H-like domain found in reverse transcriptase
MSKNSQPFAWRPLHDKCFEMIKYICCKTPVLVPVNHNKDDPIWVICDASVSSVGVMYGQGPTWQTCRPAGFMSHKFTDAQRHYRVFEQGYLRRYSSGKTNLLDIVSMLSPITKRLSSSRRRIGC